MQKFLFARIELWVLLATLLFGLLGTIAFGAAILEQLQGSGRLGRVGNAAIKLAQVPGTMEKILRPDNRMVVFRNEGFDGQTGWSWADGATGTGLPGYWIESHFDATEQRTYVELVRLSDGKIVHTWKPEIETLLADARRTSKIAMFENWNNRDYKLFHPFLMPNGDLIMKDEKTPLLRVDACARRVWMQDAQIFHHSTESDGDGGFWIPSLVEPSSIEGVPPTFQDDALTHITPDGEILKQLSLAEMFLRRDMTYLIFPPGLFAEDPLHLNDIQPVLTDGPHWKKGDLFISLRHVSMVLLYRPSTDEIIWLKQGPWIAQHDVDILDDHRIAIFDNNAEKRNHGVAKVNGTSQIMVYDFATDTVTSPYQAAMAREDVKSMYEGLYTVLPSGDYIVEDHNSGRILIFAADGRKLGQFINRNADGKVYQIGWGRYIDQAAGDDVVKAMDQIDCTAG